MSDFRSVTMQLQKHSEIIADHDAIVTPDYCLSYRELAQLVALQVESFHGIGISRDSLVGIHSNDDVKHLVMCLAAMSIGATTYTVPSYERDIHIDELKKHYRDIVEVDSAMAVEPASHRPGVPRFEDFSDGARILFATSGTTGKSKLVVHSSENIAIQAPRHVGSTEERFACLASIEHNFSKRHRLYCVAQGATNVFIPADKASLVGQCQKLNVNVLHVSAFQAQELLAVDGIEKLKGIKLKLGGSHVPAGLRKKIRQTITPDLYTGYGTTETGAIGFANPEDSENTESVGVPLEGIEVRIRPFKASPQNIPLHGEILVKARGMFCGYLGQDELYQRRIMDGWFCTGDTGYLDDQGRMYLNGRSDDMFVFNSINIYPQQIEADLKGFSAVADAAVMSKQSDIHGNIPVAFIVWHKKTGFNLDDLKKYIHKKSGIRSPRQFIVLDEIPRNSSGKILRHQLSAVSEKITDVQKSLCDEITCLPSFQGCRSKKIENAEGDVGDVELKDFDMDSMMRMEFLVLIEARFDVVISPEDFSSCRYISDVAKRIAHDNVECKTKNGKQISRCANRILFPASERNSRNDLLLERQFRRVVDACTSVTVLNYILRLYEDRLSPDEFSYLLTRFGEGSLIPGDIDHNMRSVLDTWFCSLEKSLVSSGKVIPERYKKIRLNAGMRLYSGLNDNLDKILLICFSPHGLRRMTIPNTVFLQYVDASVYDVLIVGEPLAQGYQQGIPGIGENERAIIRWIENHRRLSKYRHIRTIGTSAGGYMATLAGYYLGAEYSMSAGGRFHSFREKPGLVIHRALTVLRARILGNCPSVRFSYSADSRKDWRYARFMSWITGGINMPIEDKKEEVSHQFLADLLRQEKLMDFFQETIFSRNC